MVIMEMVPAESAGVMLTCDPLTGDPSTIYVTSNFGLGEVSPTGSAVELHDVSDHLRLS